MESWEKLMPEPEGNKQWLISIKNHICGVELSPQMYGALCTRLDSQLKWHNSVCTYIMDHSNGSETWRPEPSPFGFIVVRSTVMILAVILIDMQRNTLRNIVITSMNKTRYTILRILQVYMNYDEDYDPSISSFKHESPPSNPKNVKHSLSQGYWDTRNIQRHQRKGAKWQQMPEADFCFFLSAASELMSAPGPRWDQTRAKYIM